MKTTAHEMASSAPSAGISLGPAISATSYDGPEPHNEHSSNEAVHGSAPQPTKDKSVSMGREARWDDLFKNTDEQSYANEQLDNKNDVKSRWRRGLKAAKRLQAGDSIHSSSRTSKNAEAGPSKPQLDDKTRQARRARFWGKLTAPSGTPRDAGEELPFSSKALEQQHWLEMIDGKHRYGSNLKYYFKAWKEADTEDNFFRWLDRGDGKDCDLEELPREILEKELIKYLSAEQRLNYLVSVGEDGRIRWAHNGELVDTAAGKWRDSNGDGIVMDETYIEAHFPDPNPSHPAPGTDAAPRPAAGSEENDDDLSDTSSVYSDSYGALSDVEHDHVHPEDITHGNWLERKIKHITPGGMNKELIKKTLRGNTWIYASDMKMNTYIGIKQRGVFQHSSFTGGGKVSSAGIIVVKQGIITKLNPHSGHYRSTIQHYRAFITQLEEQGADLSHVKVGKSVMQMWGLGKYSAITKGQKTIVEDLKRKLHLKHEPTEEEQSAALQKRVEEAERNRKGDHEKS